MHRVVEAVPPTWSYSKTDADSLAEENRTAFFGLPATRSFYFEEHPLEPRFAEQSNGPWEQRVFFPIKIAPKTVDQLRQIFVPTIALFGQPEFLHLFHELTNSLVRAISVVNQSPNLYELFQSRQEESLFDTGVLSNRISEFYKYPHAFAVNDTLLGTLNLPDLMPQFRNQGHNILVLVLETPYHIHASSSGRGHAFLSRQLSA